jgi:hypothetical protein
MPTNEEIKYRVKQNMEEDYFKAVEAIAKMYTDSEVNKMLNEARADTIKQIFAELDWVTIIKDAEFKTGAYDEWAEAKAYQALRDRIEYLKKQYKVD